MVFFCYVLASNPIVPATEMTERLVITHRADLPNNAQIRPSTSAILSNEQNVIVNLKKIIENQIEEKRRGDTRFFYLGGVVVVLFGISLTMFLNIIFNKSEPPSHKCDYKNDLQTLIYGQEYMVTYFTGLIQNLTRNATRL